MYPYIETWHWMWNGEQIIQKMLLGQGTYKENRQNFMPTQLLT